MDITAILNELKESFNLKENHILILKFLQFEDLSADKICKKTGIPKGRIYDFLNELISCSLVQKIGKKPSFYSINNINEKIIDFLDHEFNKFMEKRKKILSLIESKKSEIVTLINDKKEYTKEIIKLISEGDSVKVINRENSCPFFLYPKNINEFINIRRRLIEKRHLLTDKKGDVTSSLIFGAYLKLWNKGGNTSYIVTKNSIDFFFTFYLKNFGKKETKKRILKLKKELKEYNVRIKIIKEYIASNIIIIPNKTSEAILHSEDTITGFITSNEIINKTYQEIFKEKWDRGIDINLYLSDVLKKLK